MSEIVSENQFSVERDLETRRKYCEGLIPLDFEFALSNGMSIVAKESEAVWQEEKDVFIDEDCEMPYTWAKKNPIVAVVDSEGNQVFDFSSLLPEGYSLVIPHSFDDRSSQRIDFRRGWLASQEREEVLISDWRKPEELFALMHEIGHANTFVPGRGPSMDEIDSVFEWFQTGPGPFEGVKKRKDLNNNPEVNRVISERISEVAKSERSAWAWGILALRKLGKELGIDFMKEIDISAKELRKITSDALLSHREALKPIYNLKPFNDDEEEMIDELLASLEREFRIKEASPDLSDSGMKASATPPTP